MLFDLRESVKEALDDRRQFAIAMVDIAGRINAERIANGIDHREFHL